MENQIPEHVRILIDEARRTTILNNLPSADEIFRHEAKLFITETVSDRERAEARRALNETVRDAALAIGEYGLNTYGEACLDACSWLTATARNGLADDDVRTEFLNALMSRR